MNARAAILAAAVLSAAGGAAAGEAEVSRAVAEELVGEGRWPAAAIEYRRLALEDAEHAGAWRWMAAWAYGKSEDVRERARAEAQLDAAEEASGGDEWMEWAVQALRAETAMGLGSWGEARFHFEGAAEGASDAAVAAWARRGAAAAAVRGGEWGRARALMEASGDEAGAAAVAQREAAGRKKPWVGGLLGMVPGMGYAYSGEWANALRSLLLNGLFGWALAETADDDEWALFGVCAFFEITWYSGSIYGGIDAAHRWNDKADAAAARALRGGPGGVEPAMARLPLLELSF